MNEDSRAIVVTGADIEAARLITLRAALKLEIVTGMKRSSRGRSTLALVNEAMGGAKYRSKTVAYEVFDEWLTAKYPGRIDPRPLKGEKKA